MPDAWTVIGFALGLIAGGLASAPLIARRYKAGYRAGMWTARQTVLLYPDPRSAQLSSAHIACDELRTAIAAKLARWPESDPDVTVVVPIRRKGA